MADRLLLLFWGFALFVIVWVPVEENGTTAASYFAEKLAR